MDEKGRYEICSKCGGKCRYSHSTDSGREGSYSHFATCEDTWVCENCKYEEKRYPY